MLYLNEKDLTAIAHPEMLIHAVESAMLRYHEGNYQMPLRMHISDQDRTHLLMPALTEEAYAVKLVSVIPRNKKSNKKAIQGLVSLFNINTGEPTCLLDAGKLTALRTAAVGSVGIKYLSNKNADSIGLFGLGVQGLHLAIMACQVRKIKRIMLFDYRKEQTDMVSQFLKNKLQIEIIRTDDAGAILKHCEIIITATTSIDPVIPNDEALFQEQHFCAIGSYKKEMQELPNSLFKKIDKVYCDTLDAKKESGDIHNPLEHQLIEESDLADLGPLIESGRVIENQLTCFKSVGMALFDLYVAKAFLANAIKFNKGQRLRT